MIVDKKQTSDALERRGVLTKEVRVLSTGFHRRAGQSVSVGEVGEELWGLWVAEGIIALPTLPPVSTSKLNKGRDTKKRAVIQP